MIKNSLSYGWGKVKENLEIVLFTTLLMLAVGAISGGEGGIGWSMLQILAAIFMLIIRIGYTKIFLRMFDNDKPKFNDLFKEYHLFWKYLGATILYGLVVFAGLILLIIPGIIWAVRFSFSRIIVVDAQMGPVAAMKESYELTRGKFWDLLGFWVVVILVNILGLLVLGIGLLVTVPMTTFAAIYVYRELSKSKAALATTAA